MGTEGLTDTHTHDNCTSWAPFGAKKCFLSYMQAVRSDGRKSKYNSDNDSKTAIFLDGFPCPLISTIFPPCPYILARPQTPILNENVIILGVFLTIKKNFSDYWQSSTCLLRN